MSAMLDKLIDIFSNHTIQKIEANQGKLLVSSFDQPNYKALLELEDYKKYYPLVMEGKRKVINIAKEKIKPKEKINNILKRIRDQKENYKDDEAYILHNLIKNTLYKKWNLENRKNYDQKYNIINWNHYFLSYTNRNAANTNNDYEKLIKNVYLSLPPIKKRTEENYVAKIIAKFFKVDNLDGFFDFENIKCGDDIQDEIRSYCQSCFAFIQLVERDSFTKPSAKVINWCYEEYNEFGNQQLLNTQFKKKFNKRFFFTITTSAIDDLKPAILPPIYESWFHHISKDKHISLKGFNDQELRSAITEISEEIILVKNKILDDMLNS